MVAGESDASWVACPYCDDPLDARRFLPWTSRPNLLSVECRCGRTVTMTTATLHRRESRTDR